MQTFVPGAIDGWELALRELDRAPEGFLARLRRLGEVTGALHTTLGWEHSDPAFSSEEPSAESLGLLTATIDDEIENVFAELPADNEALEPILGRGEEVRERLRGLTQLGSIGKIIRHHGDYHLGQVLWASGDWLIKTSRASRRGRCRSAAGSARRSATLRGCSARSPTRPRRR